MYGNSALLVDLYELTMAQAYFEHKKKAYATFDLFIRRLPKNRSYLVACGLEEVLNFLRDFRFAAEDIEYLKAQKRFSTEFLNYLSRLKFTGDIWAAPEGAVIFPNEPILRVTAPIIEAQIVESFLLNAVNLQTMIATKASRVVLAAEGRPVYDFSLRRCQGVDAALKAARASFIAGCKGTSNVLAGKLYGIPIVGTMAHSFVMSFRTELEAFRAYASAFPENSTLLVDTYNNMEGIRNAVKIAGALKKKGNKLIGIRLDSGDIAGISKIARKMLDRAGLLDARILASGNLDEYKIKAILGRGAKVDSFGVGTHMGVSEDAPYCDAVYKISEVTDERGRFLPTMKLSEEKATLPGRKQIFRIYDKNEKFKKDVLGLEGEEIKGKGLLVKIIEKGRIIYKTPSLTAIQKAALENVGRLTDRFKDFDAKAPSPVDISAGLDGLARRIRRRLKPI